MVSSQRMRLARKLLFTAVTTGYFFVGQAEAQKPSANTDTPSTIPRGLVYINLQGSGPVVFDRDAKFDYFIEATADVAANVVIILAQTSAKRGQPVDSSNSHFIIQLAPCKDGSCNANYGINVRDYLSWTFEPNPDFKSTALTSDNYFLCFGSSTATGFVCKHYSQFFDITSQNAKTSPAQSDGKGGLGAVTGDSAGSTKDSGSESDNVDGIIGEFVGSTESPISVTRPFVPSTALTLPTTNASPFIVYKDIPTSYLPSISIPTSTITSSTITVTPTPTSNSVSGVSHSSASAGGSKLSVGAIVGIALGVLVLLLVLAALAFVFCLRRRRAQSGAQKHEQVMLTHGHGENNSQDLLAEKEGTVHTLIHPNSNDSNFSRHDRNNTDSARQTLIPIGVAAYESSNRGHDRDDGVGTRLTAGRYRDVDETREISISPYDRDNSQVQTGSTPAPFIAPTPSSPPRRKPTNASMAPSAVSALSRNTSTTSTVASRPRSDSVDYPPHTHLQDIGEEPSTTRSSAHFEGQARYGETRHTPTFHTGPNGGVSIIPSGATRRNGSNGFLNEPGMSPEEVARLEEEERRIDLAIAEAERDRERERGLR